MMFPSNIITIWAGSTGSTGSTASATASPATGPASATHVAQAGIEPWSAIAPRTMARVQVGIDPNQVGLLPLHSTARGNVNDD